MKFGPIPIGPGSSHSPEAWRQVSEEIFNAGFRKDKDTSDKHSVRGSQLGARGGRRNRPGLPVRDTTPMASDHRGSDPGGGRGNPGREHSGGEKIVNRVPLLRKPSPPRMSIYGADWNVVVDGSGDLHESFGVPHWVKIVFEQELQPGRYTVGKEGAK